MMNEVVAPSCHHPVRWDTVCARVQRAVATLVCLTLVTLMPSVVWAQSASLSGTVRDQHERVVPGATLRLVDQATELTWATQSNETGGYVFASVRPATYSLRVSAPGFATVTQTDVILNVDARSVLNLTLMVAQHADTVEVTARPALLGNADGSVGTVIDRTFAAELPTRGRSFSALVALVPGVVPISGAVNGSGFSVNGQRETSNTLMVDGVSGLTGFVTGAVGTSAGQMFASTQTGTVNGGVSLDAVQEIRVQTSTFAAEFGRSPGAQISLVTRSGTNRFTGSVFEQFRNQNLMGNDWFANRRGTAKADTDEHQFGGTLGGPILRNRLFAFASYEGLRLNRPDFQNTTVPSLEARSRPSAIQSVLALYPEPTHSTGAMLTAENASFFDNRFSADTFGLRFDGTIRPGIQVFGRYARAPSSQRDSRPPVVIQTEKGAHTLTVGGTAALSSRALLDVRANYGESDALLIRERDGLRGWFPSNVPSDTLVVVSVSGLPSIRQGNPPNDVQKQTNVVASLSYVWGSHQFKTGIDYRRLSPSMQPLTSLEVQFQSLEQALTQNRATIVRNNHLYPAHATFQNWSWYIQDAWRTRERLTVTYGVRWDINPTPRFADGEGPLAASVFEPLSALTVVTRPNVPLWKTRYGNLFPRLGVSYSLDEAGRNVLSGGVGLFGDLEGAAVGNVRVSARVDTTNVALPLSANDVVQAAESPTYALPLPFSLSVPDPHLETPRIAHWNVGWQFGLGARQALNINYVGARGHDLLQTRSFRAGATPTFAAAFSTVAGVGRSEYRALQFQYRGRIGTRLNVLGNYVLSDAKSTASSQTEIMGDLAPGADDVRHSGSLAVAWQLPTTRRRAVGWLANGWSVDVLATARSAFPFSVLSQNLVPGLEFGLIYASLVPGVPTRIDDASAPGGWRLNPAAFVDPPLGEQGNSPRNGFRGFPMHQVDAALQRTLFAQARRTLGLRIDVFNLFNTPTFRPPSAFLGPSFGSVTSSMAVGVTSLYQAGGPRSAAVSLRFQF